MPASAPWLKVGTVDATGAVVDVSQGGRPAGYFAIKNTGATNRLLVNLDGSASGTFITVEPRESFDLDDTRVSSIWAKADSGTTTYEAVMLGDRG